MYYYCPRYPDEEVDAEGSVTCYYVHSWSRVMKSFVKLGRQLQGKLKEMGFLHQESFVLGCYFWMLFYISINTSYLLKNLT